MGYPAKYLDLRGRAPDPLELLRLIRDGNPATLLGQPLAPPAFARFNRTVNALLDGADPQVPAVLDRYPAVDQGRRLGDARNNGVEGLIDHLFDAFVGCLREAAALQTANDPTRPLLLVLDQVTDLVGGGLPRGCSSWSSAGWSFRSPSRRFPERL